MFGFHFNAVTTFHVVEFTCDHCFRESLRKEVKNLKRELKQDKSKVSEVEKEEVKDSDDEGI